MIGVSVVSLVFCFPPFPPPFLSDDRELAALMTNMRWFVVVVGWLGDAKVLRGSPAETKVQIVCVCLQGWDCTGVCVHRKSGVKRGRKDGSSRSILKSGPVLTTASDGHLDDPFSAEPIEDPGSGPLRSRRGAGTSSFRAPASKCAVLASCCRNTATEPFVEVEGPAQYE